MSDVKEAIDNEAHELLALLHSYSTGNLFNPEVAKARIRKVLWATLERGQREENEACTKASCYLCKKGAVRFKERGEYVHIDEPAASEGMLIRCNANHILVRMEPK